MPVPEPQIGFPLGSTTKSNLLEAIEKIEDVAVAAVAGAAGGMVGMAYGGPPGAALGAIFGVSVAGYAIDEFQAWRADYMNEDVIRSDMNAPNMAVTGFSDTGDSENWTVQSMGYTFVWKSNDDAPCGLTILGNALANKAAGCGKANFIDGYGGNDQLAGGGGNDRVEGGDGRDTIWGDDIGGKYRGRDKLYGEKGGDLLYGGIGNDLLDGGPGHDFFVGGYGWDTFVFHPRSGDSDVATDFRIGQDVADNFVKLDDAEASGGLVREVTDIYGNDVTFKEIVVVSDYGSALSLSEIASYLSEHQQHSFPDLIG